MTPWVARLVYANIAMFFVGIAVPEVQQRLMLIPSALAERPWTPLTYMFLHADVLHLAFNMLGLYFFGPRLEDRLGPLHFSALYFLSGLGGALLSVATSSHGVVGASGATFGVFLGYAMFWPRDRVMVWGIVPVEARVLVLLTTLYAIYGGATGGSGIAHYAHLGGYGAAFLYLKWLQRRSEGARYRKRVQTALYGAEQVTDEPEWAAIRRDGLHPLTLEELDRIAQKVKAQGMRSLTPDERAFLHRMTAR
jgi:membrane associated rhomboid family serine protease